ncbi:MAG TPA: hypothetical protein VMV94_02570 [Phycisphaerae bacterium]|nr:hypothetical protein [Phycisphaerae bacterium]
MSRRTMRRIAQISVALGAGMLFSSVTCVENAADLVGTGLSITGATGVLGPTGSQTASNVGTGLDAMADIMELARIAR